MALFLFPILAGVKSKKTQLYLNQATKGVGDLLNSTVNHRK